MPRVSKPSALSVIEAERFDESFLSPPTSPKGYPAESRRSRNQADACEVEKLSNRSPSPEEMLGEDAVLMDETQMRRKGRIPSMPLSASTSREEIVIEPGYPSESEEVAEKHQIVSAAESPNEETHAQVERGATSEFWTPKGTQSPMPHRMSFSKTSSMLTHEDCQSPEQVQMDIAEMSSMTSASTLEALRNVRRANSHLSYPKPEPSQTCQCDTIMMMKSALGGVEEECDNMEQWLAVHGYEMPESDGSFRDYTHLRSPSPQKRLSRGMSFADRYLMCRTRSK